MSPLSQERAWILGSLVTIVAIAISCIAGSLLSKVDATAIYGFGAIITGIVFQTTRQEIAAIRADNNAKVAAVKVEAATAMIQESAVVTEEKLAKIAQVTGHTSDTAMAVKELVNGAMGAQLTSHALMARRLYSITRDPADLKIAEKAEADLKAHEKTGEKLI